MASKQQQRYEVRETAGNYSVFDNVINRVVVHDLDLRVDAITVRNLLNARADTIAALTAALEQIYELSSTASIHSNPMKYIEAMSPIMEIAREAIAQVGKGEL